MKGFVMVEIIVCAIIGAGLFFGGFCVGQNTKPTQIINNMDSKTYVQTEQNTKVQNYQAQVQATIIDTKGVYSNVSISIKDLSNSIGSFSTNTNYTICKTNN